MNGLNLSASKIEKYFEELSQNNEAISTADQFITNTLTQALASSDLDRLLALIPYIETGDGSLAYKHLGELRRILRILHIISLEHKYQRHLFSVGCSDRKSLLDKYMLSLFSFRRLLFQLSQASIEEASLCLRQNMLSVFAVYTITQDDLIIPNDILYERIINLYSDFWNIGDIQLLLSLISSQRGTRHE